MTSQALFEGGMAKPYCLISRRCIFLSHRGQGESLVHHIHAVSLCLAGVVCSALPSGVGKLEEGVERVVRRRQKGRRGAGHLGAHQGLTLAHFLA